MCQAQWETLGRHIFTHLYDYLLGQVQRDKLNPGHIPLTFEAEYVVQHVMCKGLWFISFPFFSFTGLIIFLNSKPFITTILLLCSIFRFCFDLFCLQLNTNGSARQKRYTYIYIRHERESRCPRPLLLGYISKISIIPMGCCVNKLLLSVLMNFVFLSSTSGWLSLEFCYLSSIYFSQCRWQAVCVSSVLRFHSWTWSKDFSLWFD